MKPNCPKCEVYDQLVNDCVDPCFEYGPSNPACIDQSGCRTTTVDTTTIQTSSVTVTAAALSGRGDMLTVGVVLGLAVAIGLLLIFIAARLWRRQKRRLSVVNSRAGRPMLNTSENARCAPRAGDEEQCIAISSSSSNTSSQDELDMDKITHDDGLQENEKGMAGAVSEMVVVASKPIAQSKMQWVPQQR